MKSIIFYILELICVIFFALHILSYFIKTDCFILEYIFKRENDISFLVRMIIGLVVSIISLIVYLITDRESLMPIFLIVCYWFYLSIIWRWGNNKDT